MDYTLLTSEEVTKKDFNFKKKSVAPSKVVIFYKRNDDWYVMAKSVIKGLGYDYSIKKIVS